MNLSELKVKSFTTSIDETKENTVKGGGTGLVICLESFQCGGQSEDTVCNSIPPVCIQTRNNISFCCV